MLATCRVRFSELHNKNLNINKNQKKKIIHNIGRFVVNVKVRVKERM